MTRNKVRPKRPDATGRSDKTGRFAMLPHRVLESSAYASLDLTGRAILLELVMIFDGSNNGSIYLSAEDGRDRLGLSDKRPVLRSFRQLQECGLIELAKDAHFAIKTSETSRARCWRLAWHPWPECPVKARRAPVTDWEHFDVTGKRADRRLQALARFRRAKVRGRFPGVNFTPMEANQLPVAVKAGEEFTPVKSRKRANPSSFVGVNFTPYIDTTRGMGVIGWWATQSEVRLSGRWLTLASLLGHADQPSHAGQAS